MEMMALVTNDWWVVGCSLGGGLHGDCVVEASRFIRILVICVRITGDGG